MLQANELDSIINQGKALFAERHYSEVIDFLKTNETHFENIDDDIKALFFGLIGRANLQIGNNSEAEQYLLKALLISTNKETEDYINITNSLGNIYYTIGDYEKAETVWIETKELRERVIGREHPDFANSISNLGLLYWAAGNNEKAIFYWEETKILRENIYGKEHHNYARSLNNLGLIYSNIGDYSKSELFHLEAKEVFEKVLGKEHQDYAGSLNNLGILYHNMGDYQKAETYYLEALTIREMISGKEHLHYAQSLNNLGALYYNLNDFKNAEIYWLETNKIYENLLGKEHPVNAGSLCNLGILYNSMGFYSKAESYLMESKDIRERVLGNDNFDFARTIFNIGTLYHNIGDYQKAETFFLESKNIREKSLGNLHSHYAYSLNALAILYKDIGDYQKADKYFAETIAVFEMVLGKENMDYALALSEFGKLKFITHNYIFGETLITEADNILKRQVDNNFSFMSERQRVIFWDTYKENFERSYDFTNTYPYSALTLNAYDNTLFSKGLLLRTTNRIRDAIYLSNNDILIAQYDFLRSNRLSLTALKQQENPNLEMISILENRVDSLDKELTRASTVYKDFNQETSIKWQNIRDLLQHDEAAIEFVHFRLLDDKANFTDTVLYCALLLKKDIDTPAWIPLFKEKDLQELTKRDNKISDLEYTQQLYSENGQNLYDLIWQPLEKELQDINTIYYAPSGMLHQISFVAIPASFDHKGTQTDVTNAHKEVSELLSDKYNLQLLSSTREIFRLKKETTANLNDKTAAIYGGLFYETEQSTLSSQNISNNNYSSFGRAGEGERGFGIRQRFLPGTEKEAELIMKYLNDNQFDIRLFLYSEGKEETFKQLSGSQTDIIHISTHGFFFEDIDEINNDDFSNLFDAENRTTKIKNPLLRSGLLLSGSNRAWTSAALIDGIEDGILTAEEISQMNLIKTELVVLSACETGLGEAKTAEGVFGLQRAFKLAGVETLIMSLWKVPDSATADLMTTFYQLWLSDKTIDGEPRLTKKEAFAAAQQQMREKYNDVYFWAGFVMLD